MSICECPGQGCRLSAEDHRHGTDNGYRNLNCRCRACRDANAASVRRARESRAARKVPDHVHGTSNGYGNWRCRCAPCRAAWARDAAVQKARRKAGETDVALGLAAQEAGS